MTGVEVIDLCSEDDHQSDVEDRTSDVSSHDSSEEEVEELLQWGGAVTMEMLVDGWLKHARWVFRNRSSFRSALSLSGQLRYDDLRNREKKVAVNVSDIHGYGLFAEEDIRKGDIIAEYEGVRYPVDYKEAIFDKYKSAGVTEDYMFQCNGVIIDATVSGSSLRFSNHCCVPNARFVSRRLDNNWYGVYAVALRPIKR